MTGWEADDVIDFKLTILRRASGVTVTYKIYQGAVTTEDEPDLNDPGNTVSVTRYRRTSKLGDQVRTFAEGVSDATILHEGTVEALALAPTETLIPEQAGL